MAEYPPFLVWMQTTRDITDEASTYVSTEEFSGADGEGIVLPLDVSLIDDAAFEVMAAAHRRELGLAPFSALGGVEQAFEKGAARAALTALLAHLAEVDRG